MRTTTVNACRQDGRLVPMIRLRGSWLQQQGFAKGAKLSVHALLGTLTMALSERIPMASCTVTEAQTILGLVADKLAAIVATLEEIYRALPAPVLDDSTEDEVRPDLAAEVLGLIEVIVAERLAPAIDSLSTVAKLTDKDLRDELLREQVRVETIGRFRPSTPPSEDLQLALPIPVAG